MTTIKTTLVAAKYQRALNDLIPSGNPEIQSRALKKVALLVQSVASREKIKRGGKGAPLKNKLTSRTGTGRRSIRVDRSGLPSSISIGSDLGYMAAHEKGGTFSVRKSTVAAHTRTRAFGKKFKPFKVPSHTRKAHKIKLRRRAWLEPAIEDVVPQRAQVIFANEWEGRIRGGR